MSLNQIVSIAFGYYSSVEGETSQRKNHDNKRKLRKIADQQIFAGRIFFETTNDSKPDCRQMLSTDIQKFYYIHRCSATFRFHIRYFLC